MASSLVEEGFIGKSYRDAIVGDSMQAPLKAKFNLVSVSSSGCNGRDTGWGKGPSSPLYTFSISPNYSMAKAIELENLKLQDIAIFFATIDIDKCSTRKFLDDWMKNVWNKRLGFKLSFCRMI